MLLGLGALIALAAGVSVPSVIAQTHPFGAWERLNGLPGKA